MKKIFLLPGLDGSGISLIPLRYALLLSGLDVKIIQYPQNAEWKYVDYAAYVCEEIKKISSGDEFSIFAESFAGPIVPYVYSYFNKKIEKIIFCATFIKNPIYGARAVKLINRFVKPSSFPSLAYSISFLGLNPKSETIEVFKEIKKSVQEDVVRSRINEVLSINDDSEILKNFKDIP